MTSNPDHPRHADAVLGGQAAQPVGAVVLGGMEGLRKRLTSPIAEQRAIALTEAMQQGQKGLNWVIRALQDPAKEVQQTAFELLQGRTEPRVQQAVQQFYAREHYSRLQTLLAAQNWRMADQETRAAMLRIYELGPDRQLRPEQIESFPCTDLRIINQLWVTHSRGKFGFSVQRAIWQKFDRLFWNKADVWQAFADRVGWRVDNLLVRNHWKRYREISFSLNAPPGHLPFLGDPFGIFTVEALINRLVEAEGGGQKGEDRAEG